MSHLFVALCLKEECRAVSIMPYGCQLSLKHSKMLSHEFFIAAAGPAFNAFMLLIFKSGPLFEMNAAMLLVNLLPILPLDGARMLFCLCSFAVGSVRSIGLLHRLSVIMGTLVLALGVFQAIMTGFNFSLFLIGCFLLSSAFSSPYAPRLFADTLSSSWDKLKGGVRRTRLLTARDNTPARLILPYLTPSHYAVIETIDKNGRCLGQVSEEALIHAVTDRGARINLQEILSKTVESKGKV